MCKLLSPWPLAMTVECTHILPFYMCFQVFKSFSVAPEVQRTGLEVTVSASSSPSIFLRQLSAPDLKHSREFHLPCGWGERAASFQFLTRKEWDVFAHMDGHMPLEKVAQVFPEPLTNKGIDDGVDAAVGVGDDLCHLHGYVQLFVLLTVVVQEDSLKSREKDNQVVRSPEDEKYHHDDKNESDSLVLFFIGASQQRFDDS